MIIKNHPTILLFLFMSVLAQTFFTFVGGHFMSFSFLSAWHNGYLLLVLTLFTNDLEGLKAGT